MSEFEGMPPVAELLKQKEFSPLDKAFLEKAGIDAEKQRYEPRNQVESYLASLHEKSGRDHPHAQHPQRRIFDLQELVRVENKEIQEKIKQEGDAYQGPTMQEMKKNEETVLRLASGQKMSAQSKELLLKYLATNFDYWKNQTQIESGPDVDKQFALASEKLFGEFRNMVYGTEAYQDIYPQFGPEPTAVRETINKLKETETLDFKDVKAVLDAANQDTISAELAPDLKQFSDVVSEVKNFIDKHKLGMRLRPRNVTVTVTQGKIHVAWEAKKTAKDPDPEKGYYVFDPRHDADMDNPLSLHRAEYTIDSFSLQHALIKTAKETLTKIQQGQNVDDMEVVTIMQVLEQHKTTLSDRDATDNGIDQDTLAKLVEFVKSQRKPAEEPPTDEEIAFAKGFMPPNYAPAA